MLKIGEINKAYGTHITFISRVELEEDLLEAFGSFGYFNFDGEISACTEYNWEDYEYESYGKDMDEAMSNLFIEHKDKDERFKQIIKRREGRL